MNSPLWLVDRSRIADGRGFCQRARLLNYHIGPTGLGIARKGTKLPLVTGTGVHDGLAPILTWCQQVSAPPPPGWQVPDDVVRDAVARAQEAYQQTIAARGFGYLGETEESQAVTREQCYLVAGLIWAWTLEVLPEVLRRGRIVEVEHDDVYVVGCTCGLGSGIGTQQDHEARGCDGVGLMCRPDFLVETWDTHELEYHEFKTTGADMPTFRDKWEVMIQMFAATLDAERRLGKHVQSIYIHGLIKGKRQGEYNPETKRYDGAPVQQSLFCYGYRKPGNPPMEVEDWQAQYEYLDPVDGKVRRLPRVYRKTGVWELPEEMLPAGMDRSEYWLKVNPPEVRRKALVILGPFTRQTQMVEHFLEEMVAEEGRWRSGLWELYDLGVEILADHGDPQADLWWSVVWPNSRFQSLLNELFPRSYECRRYGARMACQFEGPCLGHEGADNPMATGLYIDRRPHHEAELVQAIERGLRLPDEGVAETEEEI